LVFLFENQKENKKKLLFFLKKKFARAKASLQRRGGFYILPCSAAEVSMSLFHHKCRDKRILRRPTAPAIEVNRS
jgi:hypothetical protein